MDTTTLRVTETRELLALVPHRLGFRPRESAVAVSLRPPRGEVGLVVRVDLDQLGDEQDGGRPARALVALLGEDGARRALLVLYTDDDPRGTDGPAARAAARFREAAGMPFGEVAVWVVTSTGYLSLDCRDECCPAGGRPLRDLEGTQTGARMVLAGSAVADSRADLAHIPRAAPGSRRGAARSRRRWVERYEEARAAPDGGEALARWRSDCLAAWRGAVAVERERAGRHVSASRGTGPVAEGARAGDATAPGPLGAPAGPDDARRPMPWGRIEAGLTDRRVRDAVLVTMLPGAVDLAERSVRTADVPPAVDAAVGAAVAAIVDPAHAVPPPPGLEVHERVLERVVAHGEAGRQAPAFTLLALVAWWRGDGARASVLLDRALADDPAHRLAVLLTDLLRAAIPPGWVRRTC